MPAASTSRMALVLAGFFAMNASRAVASGSTDRRALPIEAVVDRPPQAPPEVQAGMGIANRAEATTVTLARPEAAVPAWSGTVTLARPAAVVPA